jgi:hypothetical protein
MKHSLILFFLLFNLFIISQNKDTLRIKYNIALTGYYNNGNNNNLYSNNATNLVLENSKIKNNTIYNYSYGQQNYLINQNEHFFNNTFSHNITKKFKSVGIVELEQSYMRSIHSRYNGGLGFSFDINKYITASSLVILDQTNYNDGQSLYIKRGSFRVKVNYTHNHITFKSDIYAQPDITLQYFRFRSMMNFGYKLNKMVSLVLNVQDSYEQYVQSKRLHNDFNVSFGLSVSNF